MAETSLKGEVITMGIVVEKEKERYHLFTKNTSYIIETIYDDLLHAYWGKRITLPAHRLTDIEEFNSFHPNHNKVEETYSLGTIPREYPDYGRGDYRNPAYSIINNNGSHIVSPKLKQVRVLSKKPSIKGLPHVYALENDVVDTLEIELYDELTELSIILYYAVFEEYDIITRSVKFQNKSDVTQKIENALSASVDFYNDCNFELIHLHGDWARERHMSRVPLGHCNHTIDSRRGASSHQQNPFMMLARPYTDDFQGEAYAMNFVYSGSFKAVAEVDSYETTRMQMGLHDIDFSWQLKPKEEFQTPEVVMVYSNEGFNGISTRLHKVYRKRLCRGIHKKKERPILLNNWEATYFTFTQEKIKSIVDNASELGIELFVLDDGWFGKRDSDKSGLGDWFVNKEKLPDGIEGLVNYCNKKEMEFGLWFEPEMISIDSKLYKEHPDWCLHSEGRTRSEGRNQLVLDMSRKEVKEYLIHVISEVLSSSTIRYVKWDMNRHMTEVNSATLRKEEQKETAFRYILGVYEVMETLLSRFPDILFESCSGGGGRFDPGMLYYMPQTWTSDDTDAYERLKIQYGTSFAYPNISMASHVSVAPNHQVGRMTPLRTRGHVAMMGNLGYELDVSKLTKTEKEEVKEQIAKYKSIREDIQFGTLYRIASPYEGNVTAFLISSNDEKRVYVFYFRTIKKPNTARKKLKLHYMENQANYKCLNDGKVYPGNVLNSFGMTIPHMDGDFVSELYEFMKIEEEK